MTFLSAQWGTADNPMSGIPSKITRVLADPDGKTYGYAFGEGWSMDFGSADGYITVLPGQWVTRHEDGHITVTDEPVVKTATS